MSSNSSNFRQSNLTKNCTSLTQIACTNSMIDQPIYITLADADAEYLARAKMVLSGCVGGINLADPATIKNYMKNS